MEQIKPISSSYIQTALVKIFEAQVK